MDTDLLHEEPPAYGGSHQHDPLGEYLRKLERALKRGDATEHTHRPALKELLEALDDKIVATNEPKRSECGAPDYVNRANATSFRLATLKPRMSARI